MGKTVFDLYYEKIFFYFLFIWALIKNKRIRYPQLQSLKTFYKSFADFMVTVKIFWGPAKKILTLKCEILKLGFYNNLAKHGKGNIFKKSLHPILQLLSKEPAAEGQLLLEEGVGLDSRSAVWPGAARDGRSRRPARSSGSEPSKLSASID